MMNDFMVEHVCVGNSYLASESHVINKGRTLCQNSTAKWLVPYRKPQSYNAITLT